MFVLAIDQFRNDDIREMLQTMRSEAQFSIHTNKLVRQCSRLLFLKDEKKSEFVVKKKNSFVLPFGHTTLGLENSTRISVPSKFEREIEGLV